MSFHRQRVLYTYADGYVSVYERRNAQRVRAMCYPVRPGSDCAEFGHNSRAIALQMARNEPQAAPTGGKQSHEPTLDASQPPRA